MNELETNTLRFDKHRMVPGLRVGSWMCRGLLVSPLVIAAVCFSTTGLHAVYENGKPPEVASH
ncbi:MAG: hypothetical protein OEY77_09045, partial [Nitrospira sp.]|nr:hypothetical protein [Nitrospira sp.]